MVVKAEINSPRGAALSTSNNAMVNAARGDPGDGPALGIGAERGSYMGAYPVGSVALGGRQQQQHQLSQPHDRQYQEQTRRHSKPRPSSARAMGQVRLRACKVRGLGCRGAADRMVPSLLVSHLLVPSSPAPWYGDFMEAGWSVL